MTVRQGYDMKAARSFENVTFELVLVARFRISRDFTDVVHGPRCVRGPVLTWPFRSEAIGLVQA